MRSCKAWRRWIGLVISGLVVASIGPQSPADPSDLPASSDTLALPTSPTDAYGTDNGVGVYVRDSAVALEKLALAQRMEKAHEWGKSADLYQEILQKYKDRVVPAAMDDRQRIVQYASVTEAVRQAICKWPPEGLDVYRARYETDAQKMLADAGTNRLGTLHQVFSVYFPTEAGRDAGIRLMDSYFEQGEYAAVAQIGQRLLQWHPDLEAQRPMVLYRVALAEKMCGDESAARREWGELSRDYPQATGSIRGTDVLLADSLQAELATPIHLAQSSTGESWLTVGGDWGRSRISPATVKPGARLYSLRLAQGQGPTPAEAVLNDPQQQQQVAEERQGSRLGIMPAIDRGELFFQDNVNLYAVDLDSGTPLPAWVGTWPGGVYKLPGDAAPVPAGQQLCVSVSDKYVAAVMGLSDHSAVYYAASPPAPPTRLVCLDRTTGRELWTASTADLPDTFASARGLQLGSAPLIVGDNIYVIGHGGKGRQFEDCYVLCFSAKDGHCNWACYVASANSVQAEIQQDGQIVFSNTVSHLAYSGGRLFIITNLGAAAALDAYTGSVIWLNIYRDESVDSLLEPPFAGGGIAGRTGMPVAAPPWTYNPAVVQNGKVFIFPGDSRYIFIYDAGSGREIKRIWLSDFPDTTDADDKPDQPDTLLAVQGDVMYLAGPGRAWKFPWVAYDHETNPHPGGAWASGFDDSVLGRGFVTSDAVYLPTTEGLRRILLRNGAIDSHEGAFPRNGWDPQQEGPGNVVVADDHVIVAGDRHIGVYADIRLARAKLDRLVAAAPDDPEPRLHYAEVMFVSGQTSLAEQKLQEAFGRLPNFSGDNGARMHGRAFNDAMNFAARLIQRSADPVEITRLFNLARTAAQTPRQQAQYCLAVALYEENGQDFPAAMAMYQRILSDETMSKILLLDAGSSSLSPAGVMAEQAIARLMQSPLGKAAYTPYEQAAAAALEQAKIAHDANQLEAVARVYPNSQVARAAMAQAAQVLESTGDFRPATLVLRKMLSKYPDQGRVQILESMARDYLRLPGRLDVAASRLALAAETAPGDKLSQPLLLPDGSVLKDLTLSDAAQKLRDYAIRASEEALPDLQIPTSEQRQEYRQETHRPTVPPLAASHIIAGVEQLQAPLQDFSRTDRLIGWSHAGGLAIYSVDQIAPICSCADVHDPLKGAAWTGDGLLVWTQSTAYLIDPVSGKAHWSLDVSSVPPIPVTRQPASLSNDSQSDSEDEDSSAQGTGDAPQANRQEQILHVAPISDRVIVATTSGRILAIDNDGGKIAWQNRPSEHDSSRLLAGDDFTVLRIQQTDAIDLVVINSFTGELVGRKSFPLDPGNEVPYSMALSPDGTLVYTLPDRLCVQDLYEANLTPQGMEPRVSSTPDPKAPQLFLSDGEPDQLLLYGGRAYVVANQGGFIGVFSLDTAAPESSGSTDGRQDPGILPTVFLASPNISLHISGGYLYAVSQRNAAAFQLDSPWAQWRTDDSMLARDFEKILFGRDYLFVLDRQYPPATVSNKAGSRVILAGYSRARSKSHPQSESGLGPYPLEINDATATDWQAIDGGIAYCAKDGIHILHGTRQEVLEAIKPDSN
jgi:outer membrane protein assembly factor BamB/tetratricopeptide (TPR) repeat protein